MDGRKNGQPIKQENIEIKPSDERLRFDNSLRITGRCTKSGV